MLGQPNCITSFDQLPLRFEILEGLRSIGWQIPSHYQQQTLLTMLNSRQILTVAPSGSGKSTCVVISALHEIEIENPAIQGIIFSANKESTRDLEVKANQIATLMGGRFSQLAEGVAGNSTSTTTACSRSTLSIARIIGGVDIGTTLATLESCKPQLVIGTPGRVLDLLKRKSINLDNLKFL